MPSNGWPLSCGRAKFYHDSCRSEAARLAKARGRQLQRLVGQRGLPATKKLIELLDGESRLANQCAQGAFGDFPVVRDGESAVRRLDVAQDDVAAFLPINLVSELAKCRDCFTPRNAR